MSNEVLSTRLQSKLLIHGLHAIPVKVNSYDPSSGLAKTLRAKRAYLDESRGLRPSIPGGTQRISLPGASRRGPSEGS